jgi:hypothetical protein
MYYHPVWRLYRPLRGLPCDVRQRMVLDITIDEVSGALSMHAVPPAIRTVVVPAGVTVLLGLCNPPCICTGTVGLTSLSPLMWISYYAIGGSGGLSLSFKTFPKSKVRICISHIYILLVSLLPRLGEPLVHSLELWFLHVCVRYLPITEPPTKSSNVCYVYPCFIL